MFDRVLALALLTAPGPDPDVTGREHLAPHFIRASVSLGLIDPREERWWFSNLGNFPLEYRSLRERYHYLRDAPPLGDAIRFPHRGFLSDLITFNRAYRAYLEGQVFARPHHQEEIGEAIAECDALYQAYDLARDAACEHYYTYVRREALKKLKNLLGEEAYDSGELPPPVPVWRFTSLDGR